MNVWFPGRKESSGDCFSSQEIWLQFFSCITYHLYICGLGSCRRRAMLLANHDGEKKAKE